jgi:hypothetical protein
MDAQREDGAVGDEAPVLHGARRKVRHRNLRERNASVQVTAVQGCVRVRLRVLAGTRAMSILGSGYGCPKYCVKNDSVLAATSSAKLIKQKRKAHAKAHGQRTTSARIAGTSAHRSSASC